MSLRHPLALLVASTLAVGLSGPASAASPGLAPGMAPGVAPSADGGPSAASASHRPASATQVGVPTAAAGSRTTDRVAALNDAHTRAFSMVGVTWAEGSGTGKVSVRVRTRSASHWSTWSTLGVDENGPESSRAGSEPLWVDSADGVDVRVTSTGGVAPRAVRVVLVAPGTGPAALSQARSAAPASTPSTTAAASSGGDGRPTYTARPTIISRAAWGARANTPCDSPIYGNHTLGVVFHHTVNTNSYTKAQSAGIVRSIQAYHMDGRGWCDIGYNFLVDKYGQIFQGRNGSELRQVRGAHAGNYIVNTYDMGVSMIGNLDLVAPTVAMKSAVVKLIGWRLGTNLLPAKGTYTIAGHQLNRISGHRDVYLSGIRPATQTACPGRYGYAWLQAAGGLRTRVANYIANYSTPISRHAHELGTAVTGYVSIGEYVTGGGHRAVFQRGEMYFLPGPGAHWVSGTLRTEFAAWGYQNGALGWPTSDLAVVTAGAQGYQEFQNGTIYRVERTDGSHTAYGLTAGVDAEYRKLGTFSSELGDPTSRVTTTDGIDTATFQHGQIDYDEATGVATVTYD